MLLFKIKIKDKLLSLEKSEMEVLNIYLFMTP